MEVNRSKTKIIVFRNGGPLNRMNVGLSVESEWSGYFSLWIYGSAIYAYTVMVCCPGKISMSSPKIHLCFI